MTEYLLILLSAVFVNNIVMVKILGLCPFMGVSKKLEAARARVRRVFFIGVLSVIFQGFFARMV